MFFTLFQDTPANTTAYMVAGYVVIFATMLLYLASLIIRRRNLQRDIELLQDLETQNPGGAPSTTNPGGLPLTGEEKF